MASPTVSMTATTLLDELRTLGRESYKRVLVNNHGVLEPCFGVPISELQKIRRRVKTHYTLAKELYASGNYDAMYLAGLVADDRRMTREDLQTWVAGAYGGSLPGTTVPSVAAGSPHGLALAREWLEDPAPHIAVAGWATFSCWVSITPDAEIDLNEISTLLHRAVREIHTAPDLVRYQMNHFIIAVGSFVAPLSDPALEAAEAVGRVKADLGSNQCQVFHAAEYIRKVRDRHAVGKKRKSAKC